MATLFRLAKPHPCQSRQYFFAEERQFVEVVDELAQLATAGAQGILLSFVHYLAQLPFFRDEVMPRRLGLRSHALTANCTRRDITSSRYNGRLSR